MRGVGGIRLTSDDCSTDVPGLYAAGDAASRERLTGAISGGGGPEFVMGDRLRQLGGTGGRRLCPAACRTDRRSPGDFTRPGRAAACGGSTRRCRGSRPYERCAGGDAAARPQLLPLGRYARALARPARCELGDAEPAFARRGRGCRQGARSRRPDGNRPMGLPQRARPRYRESRGMHRRRDRPAADPAFTCLFEASGLDDVRIARRAVPWRTAP